MKKLSKYFGNNYHIHIFAKKSDTIMENLIKIKNKIQKINELVQELEDDLSILNYELQPKSSTDSKSIDVYKRGKFIETVSSINKTVKKYDVCYATVRAICDNRQKETRNHLSFKYSIN